MNVLTENVLENWLTTASRKRSKNAVFWKAYYLNHKEQRRRASQKWETNNPRKGDRHQLTRQSRYRIKILIEEFQKLGLLTHEQLLKKTDREQLQPSQIQDFIWLEFYLGCVVDKKSSLSLVYLNDIHLDDSSRSLFFYYAGTRPKETQRMWLLIGMIQKKQRDLRRLLREKPLLFKKRLRELKAKAQKMMEWATPKNLIPTKNKFPEEGCFYGSPDYRERRSLACLVFQNREGSGKTDNYPTGDFDIHKLPPELQPIIRKKVEMLIKHLGLDYYGLSRHGSPHLYFRSLIALLGYYIFYYGKEVAYEPLRVGEFKAKGGYVVLPISQGRNLIITEKGQKKIQARKPRRLKDYYLKSQEHLTQIFNKFGFYFTWQLSKLKKPKGSNKVSHSEQLKTANSESGLVKEVKHFTTFIKSESYQNKLEPEFKLSPLSHHLRKKTGDRFEVQIKKILWEYVKPVPQLSFKGGSRDSEYWQYSYEDFVGQRWKFLYDESFRPGPKRKLETSSGPLTLTLQAGEKTDFLLSC